VAKTKFLKSQKKKGGENMKRLMNILLVAALVLGYVQLCQADETKTIQIRAYIPQLTQRLDVAVSKVTVVEGGKDSWVTQSSLAMDFGNLVFDNREYTDTDGTKKKYNIFRPGTAPGVGVFYYAVDIGVIDNTGTAWRLKHIPSNIVGSGGKNLDYNINVAFAKVKNEGGQDVETAIQKVAYANSYKEITSTSLEGGWIRIYYGIASGKKTGTGPDVDATGVVPIDATYPAGEYKGTITLTLTK